MIGISREKGDGKTGRPRIYASILREIENKFIIKEWPYEEIVFKYSWARKWSRTASPAARLHNIHIKTADYRSRPQINSTGLSILAISFDSTKSNTVFDDISDLGKGLGSVGLPHERMSRGCSKL